MIPLAMRTVRTASRRVGGALGDAWVTLRTVRFASRMFSVPI
jgi:hypothetical protein